MTRPCLGEALTALVDGALSGAERERAHAHLARCGACRTEVEQLRALKARLAAASAPPAAPAALTAALLGLAVPGVEPAARPGPLATGPVRPAGRPVPVASAPTRPAARRADRSRHRLRRTGTVGTGLLALGVGAALLLGSPGAAPASTPVDPGSDAFVADFASTTGGVPVADRAGVLPTPSR
jgi:anti-sigma factor RsiW